MTSSGKARRRSLKEYLRTVLQRRRDDHDDHLAVASIILDRKDPSLALLPAFSSLSVLPDFHSGTFNLDPCSVSLLEWPGGVATHNSAVNHSKHTTPPHVVSNSSFNHCDISDAYSYQSQLCELAKKCSSDQDRCSSRRSVCTSEPRKPPDNLDLTDFNTCCSCRSSFTQPSLTQVITPDLIHFQSPLSRLAQACNVPSIYRHGASLQASLATLHSSAQSVSTLRLQRSTYDLRSLQETDPAPHPTRDPLIRPPADLGPVPDPGKRRRPRKQFSWDVLPNPQAVSISSSKSRHCDVRATEVETGLSSINHFSSFCVLDGATPGCPVTATSHDLRFIFEIGEKFCLSTAGIDGATMDTVTGQDAQGNAVIHLVVYSPLINPNSGRSRFVLASLLDITSFVTDVATVPDLGTISEESVIEEELQTPPRIGAQQSPRYKSSAEELLGECLISDQSLDPSLHAPKEDVWLNIASEETRRSRSLKSVPSTPRSSSTTTSSSGRSMDDILDQFIASLRDLYSEFFLLGKSPLDENSYEICNVSPKVHASRDYIEGHLTRTPAVDKAYLEQQLTQDKSFRMSVRWGVVGELKQLYCIPLFGRSNVTWTCFLVEEAKYPELPMW